LREHRPHRALHRRRPVRRVGTRRAGPRRRAGASRRAVFTHRDRVAYIAAESTSSAARCAPVIETPRDASTRHVPPGSIRRRRFVEAARMAAAQAVEALLGEA